GGTEVHAEREPVWSRHVGRAYRSLAERSPARRRATSARATAAATEALSDSTSDAIGMLTRRSQDCPTSRDRPRPSEPTTSTSGPTAASRSYREVSPSASSPATTKPSCWQVFSARVRLVTRETGTRAAAPALVRHAVAVTPAARRSGTNTPCAPNAAADLITAPRLRGSVTPSSATSSGGTPLSCACLSSSSGCEYEYGG